DADGGARLRSSCQVSGSGRPRDRPHVSLAARAQRSARTQGALHRAAQRRARGAAFHERAAASRAAAGGGGMSVQVTELKNGLKVASDLMPGVDTVSLGVWVNVGTRDERAEVNGIAHLLEHMAFKGTKRRSARQIAETIEEV